jgi:acyl carrier protein
MDEMHLLWQVDSLFRKNYQLWQPLHPDLRLSQDLGLTFEDRVALVLDVEEHFQIAISYEHIVSLHTVKDLVSCISALLLPPKAAT